MRTFYLSLIAFTMIAIVGCATTGDGSKWTCSANDIKNSGYNGSDIAFIHLGRYAGGSTYKVTKSADGKTAKGETSDGTPFTCVKGE
jgi:hypothetical protein